jgi:replicative DNA helicase
MSLARQLIKAALITNAPGAFRDIRREYLLPEEQPIVRFVEDHLRQHGQLPSEETLQENGFELMRAVEPVSYYSKEMRRRYAYNQVNEHFPLLTEAMRTGNVEEAERLLRETVRQIGGSLRPQSYAGIDDAVDAVLADYEYAKQNPGLRGVTFGWETADKMTLGAMPGDLVVFAGRPSVGKSWLQEHCGLAAQKAGHSSAVISMEMPILQLVRRRIGNYTGINPNLIRRGQLSNWAEKDLREAADELKHGFAPVHFMSGESVREVQAIADMVAEYLPDIIYIDAAYLLSPTLRHRGGYASKWEQIADMIQELKQLAMTINRPILVTVQFNRNVTKRSARRTDLSDVGGSDRIPQDASIVIGWVWGRPPFERIRRDAHMIKNREGEEKDFVTKFEFFPVNFDETTYPVEGEQIEGNVGWMR